MEHFRFWVIITNGTCPYIGDKPRSLEVPRRADLRWAFARPSTQTVSEFHWFYTIFLGFEYLFNEIMAMSGHAWGQAWPCMAMDGHIWPCLAMHGHTWPWMAIYGHVWPCMAISSIVAISTKMAISFKMAMSTDMAMPCIMAISTKDRKNRCRFIRSIRDSLPYLPLASISPETYQNGLFLASKCLGGNREAKSIS